MNVVFLKAWGLCVPGNAADMPHGSALELIRRGYVQEIVETATKAEIQPDDEIVAVPPVVPQLNKAVKAKDVKRK